jgi:hypothetical protein
MSSPNKAVRLLSRAVAGAFVFAMATIGTWGQDTSVTTVQHGPSSFDTQVRNAEVVYVEGNDLVLRLEDGKIEHLVVPDSDKFTIDGRELTVRELAQGTKLTQTITTTTAPRYVKVWHVNPHASSVILTLPEGGNQAYTIPDHAKLMIGGQKKTVFDLRKGMNLEATIVTDDTQTVIERSKSMVGKAPAPPETPEEVGVLLFIHPAAPPLWTAGAERPEETLPKTATNLPLVGLLGGLAVALSLGLVTVRKAL